METVNFHFSSGPEKSRKNRTQTFHSNSVKNWFNFQNCTISTPRGPLRNLKQTKKDPALLLGSGDTDFEVFLQRRCDAFPTPLLRPDDGQPPSGKPVPLLVGLVAVFQAIITINPGGILGLAALATTFTSFVHLFCHGSRLQRAP